MANSLSLAQLMWGAIVAAEKAALSQRLLQWVCSLAGDCRLRTRPFEAEFCSLDGDRMHVFDIDHM